MRKRRNSRKSHERAQSEQNKKTVEHFGCMVFEAKVAVPSVARREPLRASRSKRTLVVRRQRLPTLRTPNRSPFGKRRQNSRLVSLVIINSLQSRVLASKVPFTSNQPVNLSPVALSSITIPSPSTCGPSPKTKHAHYSKSWPHTRAAPSPTS